jgi:hypothetical protein
LQEESALRVELMKEEHDIESDVNEPMNFPLMSSSSRLTAAYVKMLIDASNSHQQNIFQNDYKINLCMRFPLC